MELPWGNISGLLKAGTFLKAGRILARGHHRIYKVSYGTEILRSPPPSPLICRQVIKTCLFTEVNPIIFLMYS